MRTIQLTIAILLFPLSLWYAVGVALRNLYYDRHDRKAMSGNRHPSAASRRQPTVSIGNLRVGGTGKTPHTEYLVRLLSGSGISVALLSRGYGRKTKGFLLAGNDSKSTDIGDEALMMHRKFPGLTVAVCEDRSEGLRRLPAVSAVLLDDCYQHRKVIPGLNILLTGYNDLYVDDHVLPFGNLREFRSGSRRADIIVVTKCPPFLSSRKRDKIRRRIRPLPHQKLFFSYIAYSDPVPLFSRHPEFSFANTQLLLLSGIANPEPLKRHLERHSTVSVLEFPDHHNYTHLDCEIVLRRFNSLKSGSKAIVTTEKDAMRLIDSPHRHLFDNIPFFYIPIEVKFFEQNDFDNTILDFFHNFANSSKIGLSSLS